MWAIVVTLAASIIVVAVLFTTGDKRPESALTANLDRGTWQSLSQTFDARVRQRFPVGIAQRELITELAKEGFKPDWPEAANQHQAVRDESSLVCNVAARIYWQSDRYERVTLVRGAYREEGCL